MTLAGTEPPIGSGLFSSRNEPRLYLTPDKQAGSAQSISLLCLWGMMLCAGAMALPSAAFAQSSADQDTRLRLEQQMEGQKRETEAELLEDADALDVPTSLEIDGQQIGRASGRARVCQYV